MKKHLIPALLSIISLSVWAQNPIVPPGLYMADPTARVWDDGRLYIYGSVDESIDYYCSYDYHVLSTDDLVNWTIHENSFSSRGVRTWMLDGSPLKAWQEELKAFVHSGWYSRERKRTCLQWIT